MNKTDTRCITSSNFRSVYSGSIMAFGLSLLVERTGFIKKGFCMKPFKIYELVAELKSQKP